MIYAPERLSHKAVQHKLHAFGTGAATVTLVTAPGTGLSIVPVYFLWHASAAGSFTLLKASTGSVYFHGAFTINNAPQQCPWWDDGAVEGIGANKELTIVKATGVGVGQFHVWYVVCRTSAGGGGTDQ